MKEVNGDVNGLTGEVGKWGISRKQGCMCYYLSRYVMSSKLQNNNTTMRNCFKSLGLTGFYLSIFF